MDGVVRCRQMLSASALKFLQSNVSALTETGDRFATEALNCEHTCQIGLGLPWG